MLFDTHTHMCDDRLIDSAESIVLRFADNNVAAAVEVGYHLDSSIKAVALASKFDNVYAAVGIHPSENYNIDAITLEKLVTLAKLDKVVAVGEIGFDFHYDNDRDIQRKNFDLMLRLCAKIKKPVILHVRDAYLEIDRYQEQLRALELPLLFHCYSGSVEKTAELLKMFGESAYFAFGGVITFKNFKKQDVIRAVPRDRLLLETDCPYMSPEPHRGKDNIPLYVSHVADKMAEILGITRAELEQLTYDNARRFFRLD